MSQLTTTDTCRCGAAFAVTGAELNVAHRHDHWLETHAACRAAKLADKAPLTTYPLGAGDKYAIWLSDYEVANLRGAIEATGYGTWNHPNYPRSSEMNLNSRSALNAGDWLGQIYLKLPKVDTNPNQEWAALIAAAQRIGRLLPRGMTPL